MGTGKKIGILINCLEVGGAQKMALQVFDLCERYFDDAVMMIIDSTVEMPLHPDPPRAAVLEKKLVSLSRLDTRSVTLQKLLRFPQQYLNLTAAARSRELDVIVSFEDRANIFNMVSLFTGRRVISVRHPMRSVLAVKERLKAVLIQLFFRMFSHRVSMANFNTMGSLDEFRELFPIPAQRTGVIYNFCDHGQLRRMSRLLPAQEDFHRLAGQVFIVACGRFKPVKGFVHLIRLFSRVVSRRPGCKLVILGDGPLTSMYETVVHELNLERQVIFPGFQDNTAPWIEKAAAFVLTSQSEGFPNVILEAMALRTPVVSVDCPTGPREILAPEINRKETLNQAVFASAGVLTPEMQKIDREHQDGAALEPLDTSEIIMADALVTLLNTPEMTRNYRHQGYKRSLDFKREIQEKRWISMINQVHKTGTIKG